MAGKVQVEEGYRLIGIKDLIPSPDNPRRVRDEAALEELTASVRDVGVLQPVLVRPHPKRKAKWDMRAGSRRLAAAKRAKLTEIPAIVREMTDEEALRITVIENVQREDLTPFEESEAVRVLQGKGWTVEDVAERLGKSPSWVARRSALGNLTPEWQRAVLREDAAPPELSVAEMRKKVTAHLLEEGEIDQGDVEVYEEYSDEAIRELYDDLFFEEPQAELPARAEDVAEWPVGLLEMVARMPAEVQDDLVRTWWHGIPTRKHLRSAIERHMRCLSGAPWTHDAALADLPPCAECVRRSDRQPHLFEDVHEEGKPGHCLLPSCWKAKIAAWLKLEAEAMVAEHGDHRVLYVRDGSSDEPPAAGRVANGWEVARCKKGARNALACLVIGGLNAGERYWGCLKFADGRRSGRRVGPTPLAERRDQLRRRRVAWIIKDVLLPAIKEWTVPEAARLLAFAVAFGTAHRHDSPGKVYDNRVGGFRNVWNEFRKWAQSGAEACAAGLWESVKSVLRGRLHYNGLANVPDKEAREIAGLLGLAWADLEASAAEALPEPRAWAKLNPDGTPKQPTTKPAKGTKKTATKRSKAKGRKKKAKGGPSDG